jgi:hypothetical protein
MNQLIGARGSSTLNDRKKDPTLDLAPMSNSLAILFFISIGSLSCFQHHAEKII